MFTRICCGLLLLTTPAAAENHAYMAALASIRSEEAMQHVEVLAADAMEGRRSASRGGKAAATYIVSKLRELGWQGAGTQDDYYQPFQGGRRNLLAVHPGDDSELKNEYIVIGAHYDHVGYGDRRTSFGPIGYIHNGADDNASGVAALLEFAQAVAEHKISTRRSLLIAFWDAEELGMLGSQHWCQRPTVPLSQTRLFINMDMVGRMDQGRIQVIASRTGVGLRKLASVAVDPDVWLDFTWELEENSDHYTFLKRGIPALMLHTGLHQDYHRPSDDIATLNPAGIKLVARYLFDLAITASNEPTLPTFRRQGLAESPRVQQMRERPLPPYAATAPRPRVGISWRSDDAEPGVVFLTRVVPGSPADTAGLKLYDRLQLMDGQAFEGSKDFEQLLQDRLQANADQLLLKVERKGRVEMVRIPLNAHPELPTG